MLKNTMLMYRLLFISSLSIVIILTVIGYLLHCVPLLWLPFLYIYILDRDYLGWAGFIVALCLIIVFPTFTKCALVYRELVYLKHWYNLHTACRLSAGGDNVWEKT